MRFEFFKNNFEPTFRGAGAIAHAAELKVGTNFLLQDLKLCNQNREGLIFIRAIASGDCPRAERYFSEAGGGNWSDKRAVCVGTLVWSAAAIPIHTRQQRFILNPAAPTVSIVARNARFTVNRQLLESSARSVMALSIVGSARMLVNHRILVCRIFIAGLCCCSPHFSSGRSCVRRRLSLRDNVCLCKHRPRCSSRGCL